MFVRVRRFVWIMIWICHPPISVCVARFLEAFDANVRLSDGLHVLESVP